MKNMQKIEWIVECTLRSSKAAREDDFLLICMVYKEINETTLCKNFEYVMKNHQYLGLPSFESITRARRKLQNQYPLLKAEKKMKATREAEERAFKDYYRNNNIPFHF